MFNLINFVQTVLTNKTPITNCSVTQTTLSIRCHASPTAAAIVTKAITPGKTGQVKCQGSWWTARCHSGAVLLVGETVQITHRENLTLYVEPVSLLTMTLQQTTLLHYQGMAEHVSF